MNTKEFLKAVAQDNQEQYFLLYRFYSNPNNFFKDEYQESIEVKRLILNPIFFNLLESFDNIFLATLSFNTITIIKYILLDSKEYIEKYSKIVEVFKNKPIDKNSLFELYELSKKYSWIYNLNKSIKDIDINHLNNLIKIIDEYRKKYILSIEEHKKIINRIIRDDYTDDINCFLFTRSGIDKISYKHLVCENEFLDIIESDLLNKKLSKDIIDNIIKILEISLIYKLLNINTNVDFWDSFNIEREIKIKNYNYKKAEQLMTLLDRKKDTKYKYPHLKLVD